MEVRDEEKKVGIRTDHHGFALPIPLQPEAATHTGQTGYYRHQSPQGFGLVQGDAHHYQLAQKPQNGQAGEDFTAQNPPAPSAASPRR